MAFDMCLIFPYNDVVTKVNQQGFYKFIYFVMNFTEGEFYGGLFTTLFLLIGGLIAWQLYRKNSKWQGFAIAGGSGAWPWVLASQLLSLFLTIYVFDFTRFFTKEVLWLPTFIVVVGTPPALTLVYGPGWKKLGTISVECAFHLSVCQLAECAIDAPFKCTWDSFQRYHNGFCWLDCFSHLSSTSLDGSFCCTNRSEAAKTT